MGLTLEIIPYSQISSLTSVGRIRKLLNIAKEGKIVLLQGRLRKEEEAELIKTTMEEINKEFKGIELAVIYPDASKEADAFRKIQTSVRNFLLGNSVGFTVIGPASIVKSIKRDPNKIELLTKDSRNGRKRRRR
ncbi:DUF2073 domain-containing protein [Candidatus Woesearchaeota archaeon]|nr:DUF2073 domain-containing protein [Candidatus Woesearchaeota archaeon]